MKIIINSTEITLKYSLRMFIIFENIMERAFNPEFTTDLITLLYAAIRSSNKESTATLDDVIDLLDQEINLLTDFISWLGAQNISSKKGTEKNDEKKN